MKMTYKDNVIDFIRLPEIGVGFVEVMAGILAVAGGVVMAVMKIIQPIRKQEITAESYTNALATNEPHCNMTKHDRLDTM